MKRTLAASLVVVGVVVWISAASAVEQRNVGCGLGTMAFEGQNGLLSQVAASSTNGLFFNQSFGITSGTLQCQQHQTITMNERVNTFVAENMDSVAKDIARGEGEYLDTMASLMEVQQAEWPHLYAVLQQNFSRIYTSPAVTPADVLQNISAVVGSM
jgi:hypothetical protein